mmetsp:Transcript_102517/g.296478  ORF Transcript_102517/g.296478 Transcript_102517/m.296478 type:complete len:255 (+) Transcript_102517:602-1366(+)
MRPRVRAGDVTPLRASAATPKVSPPEGPNCHRAPTAARRSSKTAARCLVPPTSARAPATPSACRGATCARRRPATLSHGHDNSSKRRARCGVADVLWRAAVRERALPGTKSARPSTGGRRPCRTPTSQAPSPQRRMRSAADQRLLPSGAMRRRPSITTKWRCRSATAPERPPPRWHPAHGAVAPATPTPARANNATPRREAHCFCPEATAALSTRCCATLPRGGAPSRPGQSPGATPGERRTAHLRRCHAPTAQ